MDLYVIFSLSPSILMCVYSPFFCLLYVMNMSFYGLICGGLTLSLSLSPFFCYFFLFFFCMLVCVYREKKRSAYGPCSSLCCSCLFSLLPSSSLSSSAFSLSLSHLSLSLASLSLSLFSLSLSHLSRISL